MTMAAEMRVSLLSPTRILFEGLAIRLNASAPDGAFGILPNHADFVAELAPSVLLVTPPDGRERIFAVDVGLLVKKGHDVRIAVRRGVESDDLESLRETVGGAFEGLEDEERAARAALSRLEADMVHRFAALRRPRA